MTDNKPLDRRSSIVAALAGGWMADAASLGMHWLYNSPRILEVGGQSPEFLPPKAEYFKGGPGYFAHEGKQIDAEGPALHRAVIARFSPGTVLQVGCIQKESRSGWRKCSG